MYLNYYAAEVNDPEDNPPIGIILCTDKDSVAPEYALGLGDLGQQHQHQLGLSRAVQRFPSAEKASFSAS